MIGFDNADGFKIGIAYIRRFGLE